MASDDDSQPRAVLFGRDLATIPCFRSSFLNGISGGIASGLIYFLLTSKVRQACNTAVFSFAGITLSYWVYCRYQWSQRKFHMTMLKAAMQDHVVHEGTEKDTSIKNLPLNGKT